MNNIFTKQAPPSWGPDAVTLTTAGITAVILLAAVFLTASLVFRPKEERTARLTTKQLVFSAAAMALGIVTSMIKFLNLPMGGSINLFSMLFITLIGYWYGPRTGLTAAAAYGLLQFILEPIFFTLPQVIIDYPLAFGALGLSGFFSRRKNGLVYGYIAGVLGRYFFSFWSGMIFFGAYAADYHMAVPVYSLLYNAMYLIPEAVLTVMLLSLAPVKQSFFRVKQTAAE